MPKFIGHQPISQFLAKQAALSRDGQARLSGSYIFAGPDNVGKTSAVWRFIKSLLCANNLGSDGQACGKCAPCLQIKNNSWPDIFTVVKAEDKKNISVEQVRELIKQLSLSSFRNGYVIGVIKDAESLSEEAANCLLKTLEEPKSQVLVFLIVENLASLPATIVSRSQILNFKLVPTDLIYDFLTKEHQLKRTAALQLAHLANGRPGLALEWLKDPAELADYQAQARLLVDGWNGDLPTRLNNLSAWLDKAVATPAIAAENLLTIWQGVCRDILLLKLQQENLTQFTDLRVGLEKIAQVINPSKLVETIKQLRQSRGYLAANVNPKLVLENILINI